MVRGGLADDGVKAGLVGAEKQGLSALNLQRVTDLGSYQTAWTILHKFRTVMTSCGRSRLSGRIEMDETYVGGRGKPGPTGRGAAGKTVVVGVIERRGEPSGRAQLQVIPNAWPAYPAANPYTISRARSRDGHSNTPGKPPEPRHHGSYRDSHSSELALFAN